MKTTIKINSNEKSLITKYALSRGILEKEAKISDFGCGRLRAFCNGDYSSYGIGSEAFFEKEDAINNSEERRKKRLKA